MFQDLEDSRWPDGIGIIGNPVIAGLFAGAGTTTDAFFADDYEVDHPTMAALNVVKDRLEKGGLDHFCLELHSTKARKKDLLKSLEERLKVQSRLRADGEPSPAIKELERTRAQLSGYVATINRSFGSSGKTIHQILWSEQRTRVGDTHSPKHLMRSSWPVRKR